MSCFSRKKKPETPLAPFPVKKQATAPDAPKSIDDLLKKVRTGDRSSIKTLEQRRKELLSRSEWETVNSQQADILRRDVERFLNMLLNQQRRLAAGIYSVHILNEKITRVIT